MLREAKRADLLRIGDLARLTGKTVRALHYYEELGLLAPVDHTKGGFRLYGQESVSRLRAIEKFQEIGMSLSDIQELCGIWHKSSTGSEASERARQILKNKLQETEDMIHRLTTTKEELATSLAVLDLCHPCMGKPEDGVCNECQTRDTREQDPLLIELFSHGNSNSTHNINENGKVKRAETHLDNTKELRMEKREQLI